MDEETGNCDSTRESPTEFLERAKTYKAITRKELPVSEKDQLILIDKDPSFVLAWLAEFISEAEKKKMTFMEDYPAEIKPE